MTDKALKQKRAKDGWHNWHVNRGRMSKSPTDREIRAKSWRRAF